MCFQAIVPAFSHFEEFLTFLLIFACILPYKSKDTKPLIPVMGYWGQLSVLHQKVDFGWVNEALKNLGPTMHFRGRYLMICVGISIEETSEGQFKFIFLKELYPIRL